MLSSLPFGLFIFSGVTLGLAWPLATHLALDAAEKLTACVALSLLGVFLFAWMIYVCALPLFWLWVLPVAAGAGLARGWDSFWIMLRNEDATRLAFSQLLITLWSVAWLALVPSYSGGDWMVDWYEHMQRTWFFLERGPRDILFSGMEALTSRPPLANVVNGAFLELTRRDFAHFQLFSTVFGSLAFLPCGLLVRRWGSGHAIAVLTVLFMANPMFIENATYAWTKLPSAFFTLMALYFFLCTHDEDAPLVKGVLFATMLATALLTHYSAGPIGVVLALAWLAMGARQRTKASWRRCTLLSVLTGTGVLATWFGWAFAVYGLKGTLMTNTAITAQAPGAATQLHVVMLNIRDTLIPHFLRVVDFELFAQRNSAGWWRDWFFNLYQTNFFFAFGSLAWTGILVLLARTGRTATVPQRIFWAFFVGSTTALGLAVIGSRSKWGLAHICLQPLVLLGLAFLAAHWPKLPRPWRLILIAGATVDFAAGTLLQFETQARVTGRWFQSDRGIFEVVADYSSYTQGNFYAKVRNGWIFFSDGFTHYGIITVGLLVALFSIALIRVSVKPPQWLAKKIETA